MWPFTLEWHDARQAVMAFANSDRLASLFSGVVLLIVGYFCAKYSRQLLERMMGRRFNVHQRLIWGRGLFYLVFVLFAVSSFREMGFRLSIFVGAAGILTVALGFASQTSASNLISGLFLIGEGSFEVGDIIQLQVIRGQVIEGEVQSIDLLSVKLRTLDNVLIRVPNEQLIKTPVFNLTRFAIRRVPIHLTVSYEADLSRIRRILFELADDYPLVMDEPKPIVTVLRFEESAIALLFAVWTRKENYLRVIDEIQEQVHYQFVAHGIETPYPRMRIDHTAPGTESEQTTVT